MTENKGFTIDGFIVMEYYWLFVLSTDPKDDTNIVIDDKEVTVPQGKPIDMPKYNNSYFSQSEYLIYKESQCRLRYLLKMKFGY